MRSKQEIMEAAQNGEGLSDEFEFEVSGLKNQTLIIELLCDIRHLLTPRGQTFPESAPPPVLDEKGRPR